jgi:hypothetical protein
MSHSSSLGPRASNAQFRARTSATSAGNASITQGFVSCNSTTPPRARGPSSRLRSALRNASTTPRAVVCDVSAAVMPHITCV